LSDAGALLADLRAELEKGVRMVAVSAVQFQTGFRTPLAAMGAMCRDAGARFFVDGVQACGLTAVNMKDEKIDFLACGAHKWLMGIEGAGFVVATEDAVRDLVPRMTSWLSYEEPVDFLFEGPGKLRYDKAPKSTIAFLEGANVSCASFVALEAALDLILKLGRAAVFDHVQAIHDRLEPLAVEQGLVSVRSSEPAARSGSLCFLPPPDVTTKDLYRELGALGIACAMPDGHLRFSPHWWTAVDEADQVSWAIGESLAKLRNASPPA
jgi:selenocysteine lyase/cysteine desulfurase